MYRVMIVDDEPPMIKSIKRIIEKTSSEFQVVAEAYNGLEAFDKIPHSKPDVVFTDIKMPVMDGITLARKLKELYPDVFPVIVSGYQDFDYVKEALKASVVDYLLKPVEPEELSSLLSTISDKLKIIYNRKGTNLLLRAFNMLPVDYETADQILKCKLFSPILIRHGALPKFSPSSYFSSDTASIFRNDVINSLHSGFSNEMYWDMGGRDENEILLVFGTSSQAKSTPADVAARLLSLLEANRRNLTIVYSSEIYSLNNLSSAIQSLYKALSNCLIIGKSQIIDCMNLSFLDTLPPPILDSSLKNQITLFIQSKSIESLKEVLFKLFQTWEKKQYPQAWLEKVLKQLINLVERDSPKISATQSMNLELQLEEVLSLSTDLGGLLRSVWDIIEELLNCSSSSDSGKESASDLFKSIEAYILKNISEAISLQSVCDLFGISQPYLSRLFRKYRNSSFNEYLTNARINEAKRLMSEHPNLLLKDIAEIVGYQDQHYFSRIFKSVTGISPSEYKA